MPERIPSYVVFDFLVGEKELEADLRPRMHLTKVLLDADRSKKDFTEGLFGKVLEMGKEYGLSEEVCTAMIAVREKIGEGKSDFAGSFRVAVMKILGFYEENQGEAFEDLLIAFRDFRKMIEELICSEEWTKSSSAYKDGVTKLHEFMGKHENALEELDPRSISEISTVFAHDVMMVLTPEAKKHPLRKKKR